MTVMKITELEFGSLLSYTPKGSSPSSIHARNFMILLKSEGFVEKPTTGKSVLMSEWVAETIRQYGKSLPFEHFFQPTTILVPTPKSSLMRPDTLWVPEKIASALAAKNIGARIQPCLNRVRPVPKAATSLAWNRPLARDHYKSLRVEGTISKPDEIILVDDVVTRGATLIGAANRLADAFPDSKIRAFAVMRTISNPNEFNQLIDPCIGSIELRAFGDTIRRP